MPISETLPSVVAICISTGGIPKRPQMGEIFIFRQGLQGDGHHHEKHRRTEQAICLPDWELLAELKREGFPVGIGTIGENLTVKDLHVQKMSPGMVLKFTGGVILELTKERRPCYVLDSIHPRLKEAIVGRCGYYARVLKEGILSSGESMEVYSSESRTHPMEIAQNAL